VNCHCISAWIAIQPLDRDCYLGDALGPSSHSCSCKLCSCGPAGLVGCPSYREPRTSTEEPSDVIWCAQFNTQLVSVQSVRPFELYVRLGASMSFSYQTHMRHSARVSFEPNLVYIVLGGSHLERMVFVPIYLLTQGQVKYGSKLTTAASMQ
jgi:hypothetical protein